MTEHAVKLDHILSNAEGSKPFPPPTSDGLEFKGNAAVVTTRLTESLAASFADRFEAFKELLLPRPSEPPMGIRSSRTSEARLNVWRSKNANLFQRDDPMVRDLSWILVAIMDAFFY
jgi:hypothetical protein